MPYKDRERDRAWHKEYMRRKRAGVTAGVTNVTSVTPIKPESVTPSVTPKTKLVRPPMITDSEWNYRLMKAEQE